jgi:hypothetical protein
MRIMHRSLEYMGTPELRTEFVVSTMPAAVPHLSAAEWKIAISSHV